MNSIVKSARGGTGWTADMSSGKVGYGKFVLGQTLSSNPYIYTHTLK